MERSQTIGILAHGYITLFKGVRLNSSSDLRISNKLLTAVWGSPGTLLGEMELVSQPEVLMGYTDSLHVAGLNS